MDQAAYAKMLEGIFVRLQSKAQAICADFKRYQIDPNDLLIGLFQDERHWLNRHFETEDDLYRYAARVMNNKAIDLTREANANMRKSQLADLMGDNPIDRGVAGLPPHLSQWAARVIELPNLDSKEDRKVRHDILRCRKDKQARDRLIAVVLDQLKGDLIQRFPRLSANGRILERRFKEDAIETLKRELRAMDERDFFKPWQQIKEHLFSHLCYFFSDRKRVDIADQILVLAHLEKIEDRWDLFELKAWLLVRWQGLSCPEAAEQMEVTSESVRYFVNRWDQQFQRLFQAEKM